LIGVAYQAITVISAGISDTAQKPSFAHGQGLSIAYLLSAHYFEHVLDSIYFLLLAIFLYHIGVYRFCGKKTSLSLAEG
jgi:hypothetical protein